MKRQGYPPRDYEMISSPDELGKKHFTPLLPEFQKNGTNCFVLKKLRELSQHSADKRNPHVQRTIVHLDDDPALRVPLLALLLVKKG